ncbi:MAG TPA: hypothetical protein VLA61_10850 [Ideonella sp.]|uniref:hypothetical protein n=1 Tax=Ideonella sp. TaxID=1929293 RepID=UPI002C90DF30|nr:hypothetical protein [Ideonella sp.]HSI48760.1 hypothetical protein [Ideonella sp.]
MWAKSMAAVLLGMPLAVAVVGLIALLGPGPLALRTLPSLLLFFPVWVVSISLPFWFRSGKAAWAWLGGATLLGFALLWWVKQQGALASLGALVPPSTGG